ncbi:MAG: DivIVA domain-containing protein, partial [bacterium]
MALDFQRPDPSSPAAVASAQFTMSRRGYREEEVRDFLRQVSVELARLLERERFLESELKALQARGPVDVAAIDEAAVTELLGAEAARVLTSAREAAQAMR